MNHARAANHAVVAAGILACILLGLRDYAALCLPLHQPPPIPRFPTARSLNEVRQQVSDYDTCLSHAQVQARQQQEAVHQEMIWEHRLIATIPGAVPHKLRRLKARMPAIQQIGNRVGNDEDQELRHSYQSEAELARAAGLLRAIRSCSYSRAHCVFGTIAVGSHQASQQDIRRGFDRLRFIHWVRADGA